MALQKGKYTEIPSDAVVLTEEEALKYQSNILNKWNDSKDIFGYKYGPFILGAAGFINGFYINSFYRNKFKLLHYGRAATYLPVSLLPAAFTALTHMEFVLKDVVLQKEQCPVCLEVRASAVQALVGCVFPLVLAPIANLSMAHKYATYNLPDILSQPKKVFDLVKIKSGPFASVLFGLFIAQAVVGSAVTYLEAQSVFNVNNKLLQLEKQLENS